MKALVMEDNPVNLSLTVELLSQLGLEALCASDAESGIRLARENKPELILMDIQLPGIDGLNAARLIKADPATRSAKIVAVTAFAMQGDKEKIMEAGCDAYLAKPIRYKEFFDTVRGVLGLDGTGDGAVGSVEKDGRS